MSFEFEILNQGKEVAEPIKFSCEIDGDGDFQVCVHKGDDWNVLLWINSETGLLHRSSTMDGKYVLPENSIGQIMTKEEKEAQDAKAG